MKWKLNYIFNNDILNIINLLLKKKINKFFFNNKSIILNLLKNMIIFVYNGLFYKKIFIKKFFTNYKSGNFIFTRKFFKFNKRIKKIKR